ncbi:sulfotransferase [Acidiphilium sp. PA]|uniref:sulfotransferase family protein n=1 Tax=Acidiphilium sp. PA TaxID=2871705 RepID=UPI0022440574|nr:sulfotransferase [Acidiphilium sp. PA]MCW8307570.1 sulfotransferase [Acidiphilium sp. PA]
MSQPLMIVGAPRSGTTFLCHVLNQHPDIRITNESRVFADLKHRLDPASARDDLIGEEFQADWRAFQRRHAGATIERFYREQLGINTRIWGDKHPPYADPALLSGRTEATPILPLSGSCLELIAEVLPAAKFIHIHRHPASVARSLARKGWIGSYEAGLSIWRQYVVEIRRFLGALGDHRHFTIAHEDLIGNADRAADAIASFLDLADRGPIARFLHAQRRRPTPFSDPVSELGAARSAATHRDETIAVRTLGNLAAQLGYATPAHAAA